MKNLNFTFRVAMALSIAVGLHACSSPDYSAQIIEIDQQIIKLDEAHLKFSSLKTDSLSAIGRKVNEDIKLISTRYQGELPLEKAKPINDYRGIKSLVKKTKPMIANAEVELPEVRNQLVNLRKALYDKANRDAMGARINEEYVAKALQNEKLAAEFIITQVNDIEQRIDLAFERYSTFYPPVEQFLDSLRNLPK